MFVEADKFMSLGLFKSLYPWPTTGHCSFRSLEL